MFSNCQVRGPRDLSNFRDCEHEALTSLRLGLGPLGVEKVKVIQSSTCFLGILDELDDILVGKKKGWTLY